MESFKMKTTADQKEQKDSSCIYKKKNILAIPKILGKTFCELMWQMLFAKFASRYMWLENSRVFH